MIYECICPINVRTIDWSLKGLIIRKQFNNYIKKKLLNHIQMMGFV